MENIITLPAIYGKACFDNEQIKDKMDRGAAGVEIHLGSESDPFFSPEYHNKIDVSPIRAVHMPLSREKEYSVDTEGGFKVLLKTCKGAAAIAEKNGTQIHVIAHLMGTKEQLEYMGSYKGIVSMIRNIASQYPQVVICLENTIYNPTRFKCDNALLAGDIDMPNVGTCLDTCHALITEAITVRASGYGYAKELSLEDMFRTNAGLCRHMHLCNAEWDEAGYGEGKGHGTPFNGWGGQINTDLERIINLYDKYSYDPMVVLEVWEKDYLNSESFSKTKNQVLHAFDTIRKFSKQVIAVSA